MEIGEKIYGFEVKEKKYVREVEGDGNGRDGIARRKELALWDCEKE